MEFIKLKIQVFPNKKEELDELDALSKSVLSDLGKLSEEDDESDAIWLEAVYSKSYIVNNFSWFHSGIANPEYTVIYFKDNDYIVTDTPKEELLELFGEL
jgi:hypothetical protein